MKYKKLFYEHIPSANEILDTEHSYCLDDSEDKLVFYHCTAAKNLPLILKTGLKPGQGESFDNESWSRGKIFLSYGIEEAETCRGLWSNSCLMK